MLKKFPIFLVKLQFLLSIQKKISTYKLNVKTGWGNLIFNMIAKKVGPFRGFLLESKERF